MPDLRRVHARQAHTVERARISRKVLAGHASHHLDECIYRRRRHTSSGTNALIGIKPAGTSSVMYLWSNVLGVPVA